MAYTQLSPIAIPGQRYSFTAKTAAPGAGLDGMSIFPYSPVRTSEVVSTARKITSATPILTVEAAR